MGNEYGFIGLAIIIIVIAILGLVASHKTANNTITEYLSKRGATDIVVTRNLFDADRNTLTFSVEFTNSTGKRISTRCKLRNIGFFVDSEIFWSEPVNLAANLKNFQPAKLDANASLSLKLRAQSVVQLPTYEISTVLPVPNSSDKIIMLNYVNSFKNLLRCRDDGTLVWQADLPTETNDVYTNVSWEGSLLTAFSRSCVSVTINSETGKIISPKNSS